MAIIKSRRKTRMFEKRWFVPLWGLWEISPQKIFFKFFFSERKKIFSVRDWKKDDSYRFGDFGKFLTKKNFFSEREKNPPSKLYYWAKAVRIIFFPILWENLVLPDKSQFRWKILMIFFFERRIFGRGIPMFKRACGAST